MEVSFTADEIAAIVRPRSSRGATAQPLRRISGLETAQPGDISFLGNPKYKAQAAATRASLVLLPSDHEGQPAPDQVFLLVDQPSAALAGICRRIEQTLWPKPPPGVHPSAAVSPEARIDPSATIGPLCVVEAGATVGPRTHLQAQVYLGRGARVGEDCWIMPGAIIAADSVLGNRVQFQPGVVIGSDGFGYEFVQGRHEKVPQIGNVVVEDDVEIGANSTIDRARFSRTVIGEGTKIDNQVQIAHNVVIGKHCILCAHVGVSGSTTIGDYVVIAGQAGLAGHLQIGKGARIGGGAAVSTDLPAGANVTGNVALPLMLERRIQILKQRLPELFRRVDALEAAMEKSSAP